MIHLLIDTSYLAYRAYHSTPDLSFEGVPTAVLFGVMRTAQRMDELFGRTVPGAVFHWCFDVGSPKRKKIYPRYKAGRKEDKTEEQKEELTQVYQQLTNLRQEILPEMQFRNLHWCEGYEADDLIAKLCGQISAPKVIVSADQDLYQLLDEQTAMWKPGKSDKCFTHQAFCEKYDTTPDKWAQVKALAGCSSDNIKGVKGVGERRAIQYINNELNTSSKTYQNIEEFEKFTKFNERLTKLPWKGTPKVEWLVDENNFMAINRVLRKYGINDVSF